PAPDSRRLIGWTSGKPGVSPDLIETCDLLSGEDSKRVTLPAKDGSHGARLEFSADNKWLTVTPQGGYVGQCWLWRIGSDDLVRFDRIGPSIMVSEHGDRVITSTRGWREFTVRVWCPPDFTRPWKEHEWLSGGGIVFPDGRTAAT